MINPKATRGSLIFVTILVVIVAILHYDFWNWGQNQWTFLAWTQEYLYRFVLVTFAFPVLNYIIGQLSWPMADSDERGDR